MNLAKISANGQITVPMAIRKAQSAFSGAAETMGISNEEDVQALIDEVRYNSQVPRKLPSALLVRCRR